MPKRIYTDEERRERKNARQREYAKTKQGREVQARADKKYKENIKSYRLYLKEGEDDLIISWLEAKDNKSGYLINLIEADIEKYQKNIS